MYPDPLWTNAVSGPEGTKVSKWTEHGTVNAFRKKFSYAMKTQRKKMTHKLWS